MLYVPALRPRAHQDEARRRRLARPSRPSSGDVFAYLMDMGTGKSKVILDEFGERVYAKDKVQDLLIVAPAGCYSNWTVDRGPDDPSEFRKQLPPEFYERLVWTTWSSGMGAEGKRRMEAMLRCTDRPRALVMNVEALSSVKRAREAASAFLSSGRAMFAIDESPRIKNHRAQRTKTILELGQDALARRIMTGLVTPRSPMDLYSQFEFLDWRILGFRSYFGYRARYAITRQMKVGGRDHPRNVRLIVGYKNVEELQDKIGPYSYRVLSEDCLDLPPQQYAMRDVELTDTQRRMYNEMREFATAKLDSEDYVTATMVLTQRLRLDQLLCGFVIDEEGKLHEVPEKRTDEMLELLGDYEGKAIIWTTHDYCVRKISRRLREEFGERSVAQFWGGNRSTRGEDERRFKSDPECRWMVATQSAGGVGNNWTVANLAVYFNNSDDLEHRMQSEKRPHRDGQTRPVLYADLVARGTIDERKIKNLRKKIDLAALISGEDYREWLI